MAHRTKPPSIGSGSIQTPSIKREAIAPDPSQIGGIAAVPPVILPRPARIFAARATRFDALAEDNALAPYLTFLAAIARGQDAAQAAMPPSAAAQAAAQSDAQSDVPCPISAETLRDPQFAALFDWLLLHWEIADAPADALAARDRLRAWPAETRRDLADAVYHGTVAGDLLAESLFAAAAMQVFLAQQAALLDAARFERTTHDAAPAPAGACPVCGGPPVASMVIDWTSATKPRYCVCAVCAAQWNYVRIKCVACESTEGIVYYGIENGTADVVVETCSVCRSYVKHLHQHRDTALEPFADDIASYGLDLMVRADGFRRAGFNPLLAELTQPG